MAKDRINFENLTARPETEKLRAAVLGARRNDPASQESMLGALTWVAFSCPEAADAVYDLVAAVWLDRQPSTEWQITDPSEAPLGRSAHLSAWRWTTLVKVGREHAEARSTPSSTCISGPLCRVGSRRSEALPTP